jgi:hypothetical protein
VVGLDTALTPHPAMLLLYAAAPSALNGSHVMIRSLFSHDLKCMDADRGNWGNRMRLWDCGNPADATVQRWLLLLRSDGYFNIKTTYKGNYW